MSVITLFNDSSGLLLILALLIGLSIGSFLNVVIHRLPIMMEKRWHNECANLIATETTGTTQEQATYNLLVPRSRCPGCDAQITPCRIFPLSVGCFFVVDVQTARHGYPSNTLLLK